MRESFIFHAEYIDDLPDAYKPTFTMYAVNYGIYGIEPEFSDSSLELALWAKIKRRIDHDIEEWENTRSNRSKAGSSHKGNQYTKKASDSSAPSEKMGQSGTNWNTMEQDGTDGTVNVSVSVNESVNESAHTHDQQIVCATGSLTEPFKRVNLGTIQKDMFELISEHNKTAPQERRIPCSRNIFSFMQKESRELLSAIGTDEAPERVISALKNFLQVASSDTWQKSFSWRTFCRNYESYTPEFFSMSRYVNGAPETDDVTKRPDFVFLQKHKGDPHFSRHAFRDHKDAWESAGRPDGEAYYRLQDEWVKAGPPPECLSLYTSYDDFEPREVADAV